MRVFKGVEHRTRSVPVGGLFASRREWGLRASGVATRAALLGFLALAFLAFGAGRSANAKEGIDCTTGPGPNMTVVIYNDDPIATIYPVLVAGAKSDTDTWMQACFKVAQDQIGTNPYPRDAGYRMYINCCDTNENGIPPGGSVTITLPFYSPLTRGKIDPKGTAQFIDWWQGGGMNIYQEPKSSKGPPDALKTYWTEDKNKNGVTLTGNSPSCAGSGCSLHVFRAPAAIANWEPQQYLEWTLGANPINPHINGRSDPNYLWDPKNVDYDVSNVNNVYMPAAMEPHGNGLIGWIGSPKSIDQVNKDIVKWGASPLGTGWPRYVVQPPVYNDKRVQIVTTIEGKIPSLLEIFLNSAGYNNQTVFSPQPSTSGAIAKICALFKQCGVSVFKNVDCGSVLADTSGNICTHIQDVAALIDANYQYFSDTYNDKDKNKEAKGRWASWGCPDASPVAKTFTVWLGHYYGWGPWLQTTASPDGSCKNAAGNQLYNTPGYDIDSYGKVKKEFDQLQYWVDVLVGKYGAFDPYVALIHGPDYVNAPYTYAYSVDDALGNMQTGGDGLVIDVGGTSHLPNPDHVTAEVHFTFGYNSPGYDPPKGIHFTEYTRCAGLPVQPPATPTPLDKNSFTSFVVPEGIEGTKLDIVKCVIQFKDSTKARTYTFRLSRRPNPNDPANDFPTNPNPTAEERQAANAKFIDCSQTSGNVRGWCKGIYPYRETDPAKQGSSGDCV